MLKLATDENFNGDILRGLFRRQPDLDVVRVQDVGLAETPDSEILGWAAVEDRVVLTHDRETMPHWAYNRVRAGQAMTGVFVVSDMMAIGHAVEEIFLAVHRLAPDECGDRVLFFPL